MARKIGQDWEPSIPIRVAEIYIAGVERLLAEIPAAERDNRTYHIAESRTRFLRALVDELRQRTSA